MVNVLAAAILTYVLHSTMLLLGVPLLEKRVLRTSASRGWPRPAALPCFADWWRFPAGTVRDTLNVERIVLLKLIKP